MSVVVIAAAAALMSSAPSPVVEVQTGSDCTYPTFPMRSFPRRMILAEIQGEFPDPQNLVLGSARGFCERGVVFVCAVVARRNRSGYLDRVRPVFGIWRNNRFEIKATDSAAQSMC